MQREIRALARDHRSGSAVLALRACDILGRLEMPSGNMALKRAQTLAGKIAAAQPAMAAVWNVCNHWRREVEAGSSFRQAASSVRRSLARARKASAGHAATLMRTGQTVATWSSSSTVEAALLLAHRRRRRFRVLCAEGRPMYEGCAMARRLAARGIPVELFTDAGLLASVADADVILAGCDAMFPAFFLNKAGTHALFRMAQLSGIPAYVVADSFKFLPAAARPEFLIREEDSAEVWPRKQKQLRVRNFYFEKVPLETCSGIITERGVIPQRRWKGTFHAIAG